MIASDDTYKCDFCGGEVGEFSEETGNHTGCKSSFSAGFAEAIALTVQILTPCGWPPEMQEQIGAIRALKPQEGGQP